MIRIGIRDARVHFRRFLMSIVAIALGVAFVVGSFCFRGMLNNQVADMMGTNTDADVYVHGATDQTNEDNTTSSISSTMSTGSSGNYNTIDADIVQSIRDVQGVSSASVVRILQGTVLVGTNNEAVATLGQPTLAYAGSQEDPWRGAHFEQGTYPSGDNEVALQTFAAEKAHAKTGDTVKVVLPEGPKDMKVSGVFSTDSAQAGTIILILTPQLITQTEQAEGTNTSQVSSIKVYGNTTTPLDEQQQQALADRINKALPKSDDAVAVTGNSVREDSTKSIQDQLGFIQPMILIFAIIALFVGSFIIANTFTMIVRESMRGYALLRSIGASPAQVFLTVVIQAILLGLVGSIIGVFLGWGILELIAMGLNQMGTPLSGSAAPTPANALVGIVVGIVVTLIGATLPARTAATAPPIQAMNETVNPERPVRARGWVGTIMVLLGIGFWVLTYRLGMGVANPTPWQAINGWSVEWCLGIGAALIVIGVIVLAPALVGPVSKVLGWIPERIFPVTGRLATRNIARAKRRTANTAAALFVGIAIVSCLGVLASSMRASMSSLIENNINADYVVMSASMTRPLPDKAIEKIEHTDGVEVAAPIKNVAGVTVNGESTFPTVLSKEVITKLAPPASQEGNAGQALADNKIVIGKTIADDNKWKIGDTLTLTGTSTVVDEQATQQAAQQYQQQVQERAMTLQEQAQRLAASGDVAGAQAKGQEAQKVAEDAQKVDPATFVKTKEEKKTIKATVGAIVDDALYNNGIMMSQTTADEIAASTMMFTSQMYVQAKPGTDLEALRTKLVDEVKSFYTVSIMNKDEFKSTMSSMVTQMLTIIYALLALSIIIAIFGIVNTLALNVSERTKEIGLLRAIGTSNGQIRGMIAIEASILSVFGTVLGILVGVAAGIVIRAVYASNGFTTLAIPWGQLIIFLVLSIFIGLIASVSPASRALRQPVLEAVASE